MAEKKQVVVACGKGLATASMVIKKVEDILMQNNIDANVIQTRVEELKNYEDKADIFITTMKVNKEDYKTPTVIGSALLVGFNDESVIEEIISILKD